jgi:predicted Rossmann fold flavoprotein
LPRPQPTLQLLTVQYDVAVIGAGAAGMMCAAQAGQRGRRVVLIDHVATIGEKIRISGGGRCNFTNVNASPAQYLSRQPGWCSEALARYTAADFVRLVERHGIPYHEKKLGQLFCDRSAHDVIGMLKAECDRGRVTWCLPCAVGRVTADGAFFDIATSQGALRASSLVVATGGLTVPKIGATPFAYRLAEQFGIGVVPPRPALVPLAWAPDDLVHYGQLSGVSADVEVSCGTGRFRENLLFTHRGLSGPAILQISSYWDGKAPIAIDLLPAVDAARWLESCARGSARLDNVLAGRLPRRVSQAWCAARNLVRPLQDVDVGAAARALKAWRVMPSGTLGYNKAEVTIGGVDTAGLDAQTMAARSQPNLYFIGEAVDVTGWLGGYNFQWAWSSGYAAAQFA